MIIPERPSLERRVLTVLEGSAGIPARIPVVLGGCGAGRTSLLLRLRDLIGRTSCAVHRRRARRDDARAVLLVDPRVRVAAFRACRRRQPAEAGAREAFDATLAFLDTARASGGGPATFLLDEFLELRTFESFPGLRTVLRDFIGALATSGNRFVLTSRYPARALRLLRDAPSTFEIIHVTPLTTAEIRADAARLPSMAREHRCHPRGRSRARARRARAAGARALRRPARVRAADRRHVRHTRPAMAPIRSARCPPCWRRTARSIAAAASRYELRLHRARGYGALKAILTCSRKKSR